MAEPTAPRTLLEPILDGIQTTYYFNGRLFTAEDLKTDLKANSQHHQQLGQAAGEGVVGGLEVTLVANGAGGDSPILSVTNGLALSRNGQAIALPADVQVALAPQNQPAPAGVDYFASGCAPAVGSSPLGKGIYIFMMTAASGYKEQAPKREFGDPSKDAGCGSRYVVEGVKFRMQELPVSSLTGVGAATRDELTQLMTKSDSASLSLLRNWLAHVCLGTEETARFLVDPFARVKGLSSYLTYGALDVLRASGGLTDCDVPLALVYWPNNLVQFVDMWSARRRLIPESNSSAWPLPLSPRRQAEAEAAFLQFENQIDGLFQSNPGGNPLNAVQAQQYFRYLPPLGMLPIGGKNGSRGINLVNFASGLTIRDQEILATVPFPDRFYIEGARLWHLTRDALTYPPIDLRSGELIWAYLVRENIQAVDDAKTGPPQPYVVLANGHMPFAGEAHYDRNRWDYGNYA